MASKTAQAKVSIKPLAGYVLVEPQDAETVTVSGIVLPDTAQEKPQIGRVLAVGAPIITDNGTKINSPVAAGDRVYFKKWVGDDIKVGGAELKLVKFDDLMAIVV
ncbi:co-chaperone GroES [Candidatus Daviesbacteria bacterium]|nr:co-chaperone GroES [Candidatus Daviesbacteria bacterium]